MVVTWLGVLRQAGLGARMGNTGYCKARLPGKRGRGDGWQEGHSGWEQRPGGGPQPSPSGVSVEARRPSDSTSQVRSVMGG